MLAAETLLTTDYTKASMVQGRDMNHRISLRFVFCFLILIATLEENRDPMLSFFHNFSNLETLKFKKYKYIFILCVWDFACMYVYHVHVVPVEARRGHYIFLELNVEMSVGQKPM